MPLNQQQLAKEGIYEGKAPLPSLLADLDEIGKMAENVTALRRRRLKTGGYIILGGIMAVMAGIFFPPLVALAICDIVFGIGYLIYGFSSGGKILAHPLRLGIARERLKMIQQDAGQRTPFALRLAISSKPVQLTVEAWAARKKGKQSFFEESWLSLEGRLLDGTTLTDEIKDLMRQRTSTNPRGKRKTKTRKNYLVNVRFSYPSELYGDARPAANALQGEMKVGPSATLRGVRVTEKAIVMKALVASEREITQTAGMLSIGGYRILNLARKSAAGQRGKAQ